MTAYIPEIPSIPAVPSDDYDFGIESLREELAQDFYEHGIELDFD